MTPSTPADDRLKFSAKRHDLLLTPGGVRFLGRRLPCVIGRGGVVSNKAEGDGATPAGQHRIAGALYRPDRMVCPVPWAIPIRPGDLWCDDPAHKAYNQAVRAPFAGSHETLWRSDPLYDLVLVTDWNWPRARPGLGSAIFLHRWRRPGYPTEGCLAFSPDHLLWIARNLSRDTRLIVPPQP